MRGAKLAGAWAVAVAAAGLFVQLAVTAMEVEVVIARVLAGTPAAAPAKAALDFLRGALGYGS